MPTVDFARTLRNIEGEVEEGIFTRGAQVSVRVGGEELFSSALGEAGNGTPMTAGSVLRVYCAIKPVTALAVARQVDAGTLDLDEPLHERLPDVRALADGAVTLRHVLNHTAGIHVPGALEVEMVAPAKRPAYLDAAPREPGWHVGVDAGYSEIFGWDVLGRLLEQVTGEPLGQHLRSAVLEPLGLTSTWIGMTPDEYRALLPRIGVSYDMRTDRAYPLLLERGERMCTEVNPAHGGYSTASDMSRLYARVLDGLAAEDAPPGLPSPDTLAMFTTAARPVTYDVVLDRPCEHGLGFMTALKGHAFGAACSPRSFGHSGNVGATFAFADPDYDLAVGVVFNGVVDHESAFLRRPALVRAIYLDLDDAGLGPAQADATEADADAPEPRRRRWFGRHREP